MVDVEAAIDAFVRDAQAKVGSLLTTGIVHWAKTLRARLAAAPDDAARIELAREALASSTPAGGSLRDGFQGVMAKLCEDAIGKVSARLRERIDEELRDTLICGLTTAFPGVLEALAAAPAVAAFPQAGAGVAQSRAPPQLLPDAHGQGLFVMAGSLEPLQPLALPPLPVAPAPPSPAAAVSAAGYVPVQLGPLAAMAPPVSSSAAASRDPLFSGSASADPRRRSVDAPRIPVTSAAAAPLQLPRALSAAAPDASSAAVLLQPRAPIVTQSAARLPSASSQIAGFEHNRLAGGSAAPAPSGSSLVGSANEGSALQSARKVPPLAELGARSRSRSRSRGRGDGNRLHAPLPPSSSSLPESLRGYPLSSGRQGASERDATQYHHTLGGLPVLCVNSMIQACSHLRCPRLHPRSNKSAIIVGHFVNPRCDRGPTRRSADTPLHFAVRWPASSGDPDCLVPAFPYFLGGVLQDTRRAITAYLERNRSLIDDELQANGIRQRVRWPMELELRVHGLAKSVLEEF